MTMREKLCIAAVKLEMKKAGRTPYPEAVWAMPDVVLSAVEYYGDFVDAFLETLREPDEAMHDAGAAIIAEGQGNPHDRPLPTLRNAFTAMIDHARKG